MHPTREEQDSCRHADEDQARRKVRVHPHVCTVGIYLQECLMENPLLQEAEPVGLQDGLPTSWDTTRGSNGEAKRGLGTGAALTHILSVEENEKKDE